MAAATSGVLHGASASLLGQRHQRTATVGGVGARTEQPPSRQTVDHPLDGGGIERDLPSEQVLRQRPTLQQPRHRRELRRRHLIRHLGMEDRRVPLVGPTEQEPHLGVEVVLRARHVRHRSPLMRLGPVAPRHMFVYKCLCTNNSVRGRGRPTVSSKQDDKIRCEACPIRCRIAEGRTGACDRYANYDGVLTRVDPVVLLERQADGGAVVPFSAKEWQGDLLPQRYEITGVGAGDDLPGLQAGPLHRGHRAGRRRRRHRGDRRHLQLLRRQGEDRHGPAHRPGDRDRPRRRRRRGRPRHHRRVRLPDAGAGRGPPPDRARPQERCGHLRHPAGPVLRGFGGARGRRRVPAGGPGRSGSHHRR